MLSPMQPNEGMVVYLLSFLASALNGGECLSSALPLGISPRPPDTDLIGVWVEPIADLGASKKVYP